MSTTRFERMPSLIHTFSGRMVDPLDLNPEDVCVEDIAHALANQCRFSGHTAEFYSVAQHCVLASRIVPKAIRLDALLHDGAEAYLQDMAKPLKNHENLGQSYRAAERRIEKVIGEVFDVTFPFPPEVKQADEILLVTEARDLMHGTKCWTWVPDVEPLPTKIKAWGPRKAKREFMLRFEELKGGRNG